MLFDPDAGLTLKEVLQRKWDTVWDESFKSELLQLADLHGCTWMEAAACLILQCEEQYQDPLERPKMDAWHEWQQCPYGRDPWLNKEDPHAP